MTAAGHGDSWPKFSPWDGACSAEVPGREIVVGGVTKPWEANPTFRALPPDEFQGFCEHDYVKIVWTLRADPVGTAESIFRTETRVITTNPAARAKFRRGPGPSCRPASS